MCLHGWLKNTVPIVSSIHLTRPCVRYRDFPFYYTVYFSFIFCGMILSCRSHTHTPLSWHPRQQHKQINMCFSHTVSPFFDVISSFSLWPWADSSVLGKYLIKKYLASTYKSQRFHLWLPQHSSLFMVWEENNTVLDPASQTQQFRHSVALYKWINPRFSMCVCECVCEMSSKPFVAGGWRVNVVGEHRTVCPVDCLVKQHLSTCQNPSRPLICLLQ